MAQMNSGNTAASPGMGASETFAVFRGRHGSTSPAAEWAVGQLHAHAVDPDIAGEIAFCVNELLANIIDHAFTDDLSHTISLTVVVRDEEIELRLTDDGEAFDPTVAAKYEPPASLEEASHRGYGLHIVRTFMDDVRYQRADGRNTITLVRRRTRSV